jgi:hypothetical protein
VDAPNGRVMWHLPLTVGLGWAMVVPRNITVGPWYGLASGAWLALLVLPVAFYATVAAGPGRPSVVATDIAHGHPDARAVWWWTVAPVAVLIALGGLPFAFGVAATGWLEWVGAVIGLGLGTIAGLLLGRARFVHLATSESWTVDLRDTDGALARRAR